MHDTITMKNTTDLITSNIGKYFQVRASGDKLWYVARYIIPPKICSCLKLSAVAGLCCGSGCGCTNNV